MKISLALSALLLSTLLHAESVDEDLAGFDDSSAAASVPSAPVAVSSEKSEDIMDGFDDDSVTTENTDTSSATDGVMEGFDNSSADLVSDENATVMANEEEEERSGYFSGFSGKLIQQFAMGYNKNTPQSIFASLRQTLFLDYEKKFENGIKFKTNVRGFYDPMYDVSNADYYPAEEDELRTEVELFEAYFEWTVIENLDAKIGRQIVVWGRSDTIRITDILNPVDYRRPGTMDLEDLRLPTTMLKFDYQIDNWNITPIAIVEQRFSKYPPFGSIYFPAEDLPISYNDYKDLGLALPHIDDESYKDVTFALSAEADFDGWDISLYAARVYQDQGYIDEDQLNDFAANRYMVKDYDLTMLHNKTNMFGGAVNYVKGSWLLKSEVAYFSDLLYTYTSDRTLSRTDGLVGVEYTGVSDTTIAYDFSIRHFNEYDTRIAVPLENISDQNTYQHALRINSNFVNDTLHANYLISIFGEKVDEGGYQRAWLDYEIADAINATVGVVDYFGGSLLFDRVKDFNVVFMDMSYNF